MAGHSKWAKIQHSKGVNDRKRGVLFGKISAEITAASRACGGDLTNVRLSTAIAKAKSNSVPKDNIESAIKKGTGVQVGDLAEEVLYEGQGPAGVSVIIRALTDNKKRTAPAVRSILSKRGGALGTAGSVMWQFEKKAYCEVDLIKTADDEDGAAAGQTLNGDDVVECAIESGASDVDMSDDGAKVLIYAEVPDLASIKAGIFDKFGVDVKEVEIMYKPKGDLISLSDEEGESLSFMLDDFEDNPDVQEVYINAA